MSLYSDLAWSETERLGQDELNRRAKAVADAIEALRVFVPDWQAEVATLRAVGLERLNDALLPAFEQITELTYLGLLLSATSASEVTIGGGSKTFIIPETKRRSFAPTPLLVAYAGGNFGQSMVGSLSGYDPETGLLVITVESVQGEGTHSDWTIGPIATTADLEALRDRVEDDAAVALEARETSVAKAVEAIASAAEAEASKAGADQTLADFKRIWWGALSVAPEGAQVGAQFLDVSVVPNVVKVRTATGWNPTVTVAIGGSRAQVFPASAGQTVFTVDGGFSNGSVNVNGAELFDGRGVTLDPTNSRFTLDNGVSTTDVVAFRGYLANAVTDIYTKSEADALLAGKQASHLALASLVADPLGNNKLNLLSRLGPAFGGNAPAPSGAGVGLADFDFNAINVPGVFTIATAWRNGPFGAGEATYTGILIVFARAFNNGYWQELYLGERRFRRFTNSAGGLSGWAPWRHVPNESVGSVGNSDGFPSGALMERSSNSNGEYVKFADGTMICICAVKAIDVNQATGGIFRSDALEATFPAAFAAVPVGFGSASSTIHCWVNARASSTTSISGAAFSSTARTGDTFRLGAVGRWF